MSQATEIIEKLLKAERELERQRDLLRRAEKLSAHVQNLIDTKNRFNSPESLRRELAIAKRKAVEAAAAIAKLEAERDELKATL